MEEEINNIESGEELETIDVNVEDLESEGDIVEYKMPGKMMTMTAPENEFFTEEPSSNGLSSTAILVIVISICAILGITLGIILGRRAAKK